MAAEKGYHLLRYHHLGIAVTNLETSLSFYGKLGFKAKGERGAGRSVVVENGSGFQLHLLETKREVEKNENLLMDLGDEGEKYPGHTHMSFGVKSVSRTRRYFENKCGLTLSGTRGSLSIFIRDPDRVVLEFERNDGVDEEKESPLDHPEEEENPDSQSFFLNVIPRGGIDHVGTRVFDPAKRLSWYQDVLGFTRTVFDYELDTSNPRKNFKPWIVRSDHGIRALSPVVDAHFPFGQDDELTLRNEFDENLILNGTVPHTNVLLRPNEEPFPGIVYVAIEVSHLEAFAARWSSSPDFSSIPEDKSADWGLPSDLIVHLSTPSIFIRDPDLSVFRIVQKQDE